MQSDDLLMECSRLNNAASVVLEITEKMSEQDEVDVEIFEHLTKSARYLVTRHSLMLSKYKEVKELEREQRLLKSL